MAAIGLYSLIVFGTEQRLKELGIRTALNGSTPRPVWRGLGGSLKPVELGTVMGGGIALLARRRAWIPTKRCGWNSRAARWARWAHARSRVAGPVVPIGQEQSG